MQDVELTRTNRPFGLTIYFSFDGESYRYLPDSVADTRPLPVDPSAAPIGSFETSFSGGSSEGETPVPIPNTEVKPLSADGTAWVTVWESRSPPGIIL